MHETNRQNIMNAEIMAQLRPLLKTENPDVSVMQLLIELIQLQFISVHLCAGFEGNVYRISSFDFRR